MDDHVRDDAMRLLWAARDYHVELHGGDEGSFGAGTTLNLTAAGQRTGLPIGYPSHEAAVEWLVADGAIEPDPLYQNVVDGPIHRLTTYGLELLAESP
jgi:hypothetical protein